MDIILASACNQTVFQYIYTLIMRMCYCYISTLTVGYHHCYVHTTLTPLLCFKVTAHLYHCSLDTAPFGSMLHTVLTTDWPVQPLPHACKFPECSVRSVLNRTGNYWTMQKSPGTFQKPLESNTSLIRKTQCPCDWIMNTGTSFWGSAQTDTWALTCLERQGSDNDVEAALLGCSSLTSTPVVP
jgi:hypothetical protein